jgi:hypothetical protein
VTAQKPKRYQTKRGELPDDPAADERVRQSPAWG